MNLILDIAFTHVRSRARQTLVAIAGVSIGVGFSIMMAALMQGSQDDFIRQLVNALPHITISDERRDPHSILNWTERMIRARKECPEISWGHFTVLRTNAPQILALRYDWRDTSLATFHNFSSSKQKVEVKIGCERDALLVEVFDGRHSKVQNDGAHRFDMDGYAWRWFRVGGPDNALDRSDLDLTNPTR